MPTDKDMAVLGTDALKAIKDWVKKQKPETVATVNPDSENPVQSKAVAKALEGYVRKDDIAGGAATLKITFDGDFEGQAYTITGGSESYEGVVPPEMVVRQTVKPEGMTEYTISATAKSGKEPSTHVEQVQFYGVYPCTLEEGGDYDVVSWADGTDEQIVKLIEAADKGLVDLARDCNWQVGDTRTVTLGAMAATDVGEAHESQQVTLVLSHAGATPGISRADGKEIHFQVDLVDSLDVAGYMNSSSTNAGSWDKCARRKWCNNAFYNAVPETIRAIFKKMKVTTATEYNGSANTESEDFFALRAAQEVFGSASGSNATEAAALGQVDYYKNETQHRVKKVKGSANSWWLRSPYSSFSSNFCNGYSNGSASGGNASNTLGVSPFGCI